MRHSLKKLILLDRCPRAYAAARLLHLPDPKHPEAEKGIQFHQGCESWLQGRGLCLADGTPINPESEVGRLCRAALAYAPPGALPEVDLTFDLFGRTVECHLDSVAPSWSSFDDWKSSSGWGELTNATLKDDIQAHWQAVGFMKATGRSSCGPNRWIYADKPSARRGGNVAIRIAEGCFDLQESEAWLFRRVYPAMLLAEALEGTRPPLHSVPHDPLACKGTGKMCNFYGHCQMRPSTGPTLAQLRSAR